MDLETLHNQFDTVKEESLVTRVVVILVERVNVGAELVLGYRNVAPVVLGERHQIEPDFLRREVALVGAEGEQSEGAEDQITDGCKHLHDSSD